MQVTAESASIKLNQTETLDRLLCFNTLKHVEPIWDEEVVSHREDELAFKARKSRTACLARSARKPIFTKIASRQYRRR